MRAKQRHTRIPRPCWILLLLGVALAGASLLVGCGSEPSRGPAGRLGSALPDRLPASRGGKTFVVNSRSGSDSNDGSRSRPWKSINHALATVPASGSVISVLPGDFDSRGTDYALHFSRRGDPSNPITLRAAKPGTVVIRNADPDTPTHGAWIVGASGLRVEGLTFAVDGKRGGDLFVGHALIENSDRIEFFHCTFHEAGPIEIRGGGSDGDVSEDVWLLSNTFRPSGDDPTAQVTGLTYPTDTYGGSKGSHYVYAGQMGDVTKGFKYTSGAERMVVANNLFIGTTPGRDVQLGPQARDSFVVNNTFYGNQPAQTLGEDTDAVFAGEGVAFFANEDSSSPATSGNVVANNIFAELDGHAVFGSGPEQEGNRVMANLAWNVRNGSGHNGDEDDPFAETFDGARLFTEGPRNFDTGNPQFVDANNFDFHLGAGSAAHGRGIPALSPVLAFDGSTRSPKPDLGAY